MGEILIILSQQFNTGHAKKSSKIGKNKMVWGLT